MHSCPLSASSGLISRVDIHMRVALTAAGLLAGLLASSPWIPATIGALAILLLVNARIPARSITLRMAVPLFMGAAALMASLFLTGSTPLFRVDAGWLNLTGYQDGLERGLLVLARVFGGAGLVLLLSMTTPVTELLAVARRMRISPLFLELTGMVYRYIFVLAEEAASVMNAQKVRLGYRGFAAGLASFGVMSGMVFVRSYDRAERVATAMRSRGLT